MPKICKTQTQSKPKASEPQKIASSNIKNNNGAKDKKAIFSFFDPEAHQVSIAGDFNNWDQGSLMLKRKESGEWSTSITLKPGVYDYRYIVDGEWRDDPKSMERVPNPFGSFNNRIVIK